jgi:hypothetical protein
MLTKKLSFLKLYNNKHNKKKILSLHLKTAYSYNSRLVILKTDLQTTLIRKAYD